jgi:hypothetical protein
MCVSTNDVSPVIISLFYELGYISVMVREEDHHKHNNPLIGKGIASLKCIPPLSHEIIHLLFVKISIISSLERA